MASSSADRFFGPPANLNGDDSPEDSSSPEDSEFDRNLLPPRLFATDRYPVSGRINSSSKPEYLLELVDVLAGTTELEWLKSSYFGGLFRLPVRISSISGKLVHQFLCRSLVTDKLYEIWFVFGGRPIRFSLREFGILTGLNCGEYPSRQAIRKMLTPVKKGENYLNKLIGPNNTYTIPEVINILREDKDAEEAEKMDSDRRKRLALVVIVDGIVAYDTTKPVATVKISEMLKDLDAFMQYPWGRKSFELTLEMVKVGKFNRNVNVLAEKLSQSHTATHGFTIALQLLILEAVPLLQQFLPDLDPNATFSDRPVSHLTFCKTFHNSNILQVEMDPNLQVESIIQTEDPKDIQNYSWVDELDDDAVDYIVNNLKDGHTFIKEDWLGGFDDLPLLSPPVKAKGKKAPSKRVNKSVLKKHSKSKFDGPNIEQDFPSTSKVDAVNAEELLREVDRRNNEHTAMIQQMIQQMKAVGRAIEKDEIRDHVLSVLREEGLLKTPVNMNHTELLNKINNSRWNDYGEGLRDMFNNIKNVINDPEIGQEANEYLRRLSDDGVAEHGTSGEQISSFSECVGNVNINVEVTNDSEMVKVSQIDSVMVQTANVQVTKDSEMPTTANMECLKESDKDGVMVQTANVQVTKDSEMPKTANMECLKESDKDGVMVQTANVQVTEDSEMAKTGNMECLKESDKDGVMVQTANVQVTEDSEMPKTANMESDKDGVMVQTANVEVSEDSEMTNSANMQVNNESDKDVGAEAAEVAAHMEVIGGSDKDVSHNDAADEIDSFSEGDAENLDVKDGNAEIQELSSSSESCPSQTSDTGINQEEQQSPSSKKRSFQTPLPSKRPSKKPKRFGQSESSKKSILPAPSDRDNYLPLRVVKTDVKKKFLATIGAYKHKTYIIDGHSVKSSFFKELYTPKNWVHSHHMEAMLSLVWRTCGQSLSQSRVAVLDTWFTYILCNDHSTFQKAKKKSSFPWNNVIKNYVRGVVPGRSPNLAWFTDVDTVYVPMNWGKRHWVGCVIYLKEAKIRILDPLIVNHDEKKLPRLMKPLLDMLPFIIKDFVTPDTANCPLPTAFTYDRPLDVYQNDRSGDCGPLAVKFIELHSQGLPLDQITDKMVDELRMAYAVDVYEEFVVSLN